MPTPRPRALLLACILASGVAAAQSQTLLAEDFETGAPGWTFVNAAGNGLWHLGADGTCGAVTQMAAYNDPATCTYVTGGANFGFLVSPAVTLSGQPPFTVTLDSLRKDDAVGDLCCVQIADAGATNWTVITCTLPDDGVLHAGLTATITPVWTGHAIQFRFLFSANIAHNNFPGWSIDNVSLSNAGGWTDLGHALAGAAGAPLLAGTGTLSAGSDGSLDLSAAAPDAPAALVLGLSSIEVPFKGGVLVPAPLAIISLTTGAAGEASLPFVFPPAVPPGTAFYFQVWIADAGGPAGFAASNALRGSSS